MPVIWNLKKWLAVEHDIYRPSELQAVLAERADVHLSLQAISTLINGKPQALRMSTVQALCDALNCKLSDFFDVLPETSAEQRQQERQAAGSKRTASVGRNVFPDPRKGERGGGEK
jgi:DNA-binding Xre family transcriptional regulator